jgi:hypothetical protein
VNRIEYAFSEILDGEIGEIQERNLVFELLHKFIMFNRPKEQFSLVECDLPGAT